MSGDRFQPTADTSGGGSGGITQLTQDVLAGPGSGSVAATVVGLRTRGISATAPTNGQVLEYNSGTGLWTPTSQTVVPPRRVPLDSHDLICWTLDEAASPFANSGAGGACSLTAAGDVKPSIVSVFDNGAYLKPTVGTRLLTANTSVGSTATVGTLHGWIRPLSFPAYSTGVIKIYGQIGQPWVSPFISIGFYLDSSLAGAFYGWVAVSGSPYFVHNTTDEWARIPLNQWAHVAVVYDGASVLAYLNGTLVGTTAVAGSIDWGANGPWNFGDVVNNPGGYLDATFDDWRFRDVAMSATDVSQTYLRGIGWYP